MRTGDGGLQPYAGCPGGPHISRWGRKMGYFRVPGARCNVPVIGPAGG